jgi:Zn-dependent peptidase ImmA (M78 family)/DNA-binding XRE family transcriptional regulator
VSDDTTDLQEVVDADPKSLASRLREARVEKGLRQEDAAARLGVARTTIINIEKALRRVRPQELVALAGLYERPLNELLRPAPAPEPLAVQFRLAPSQRPDDVSLRLAIDELGRLCDDYVELERLLDASLARREPPPYVVEGFEQAAAEVAGAERSRLSLGDGPALQLRDLLEEEVGLRIFSMPLPRGTAGLFAYANELGGCVAINAAHPSGRQVLSLAHEYAHFLTTRDRAEVTALRAYSRVPESERFADAFARHFLMPSSGVIRHFNNLKRSRPGNPTRGDLVRLAHFYRVSLEAMVLRLEDLRLVRVGTWDELRASGFKVHEALELLDLSQEPPDTRLLPRRYEQLAVEAYLRGIISEGQFARFLRTDRLRARERAQDLASQYGIGQDGEITHVELDLVGA